MKKMISFLCLLCVFITVFTVPAFAQSPYTSYSYSSVSGPVHSPDTFNVEEVVSIQDFGQIPLKSPEEIFITENGELYILDTGNNRVVITDVQFSSFREISELSGTSSILKFNNPKGLFVNKKNEIFVADTGNRRVLKLSSTGEILLEITKPTDKTFDQNLEFIPNKLVADAIDNIYVVCTGVYEGAVRFENNGDFSGYFGAASVVATANILTSTFWKSLMTSEQKDSMSKYVPAEIKTLHVTHDNFIFSITNSQTDASTAKKEQMDTISKLNPKNNNILVSQMSDKASAFLAEDGKSMRFVDIVSDSDSLYYVIDDSMCRVLWYDSDSNLLSAFGGKGNADGLFRRPVAIEYFDNKLYILDALANSITIFKETEFGSTLRDAVTKYSAGKYEEAIEPFQKVLDMDENYEFAYVGIGSALLGQGKYKEAMECFKKGYDSEKYNTAFKSYRIEFIRDNFIVIIALVIVVIAIVFVMRNFVKKSVRRRQHEQK